jgi:sensor histidine kinase YesM
MLIQPFVENAINHGLVYSKNNEGVLVIHFGLTEEYGVVQSKTMALEEKRPQS